MTTETKAKYTPGPWKVEIDNEEFVDGPDGKSIFGGASTQRPDEENIANARLIAAAPELLETLKALVDNPIVAGLSAHIRDEARRTGDANAYNQARVAIAKALGEIP